MKFEIIICFVSNICLKYIVDSLKTKVPHFYNPYNDVYTVAIKKTRHLVNLPYKAGISN